MKLNNYFFDDNQTRYQLVKSTPGKTVYNWLFLPGGPGVDSNYLLHLINELDIEGNCWLIDFLFNGNNVSGSNELDPNKICQNWGEYFLAAVNKFENPILVGHSFGGYYPLFFPVLENILKGFVILNSAPAVPTSLAVDVEEFDKRAKENNLPLAAKAVASFLNNPTISTITERYLSMVPYGFPTENLDQGIQLINSLIFNVDTGYWWLIEGAKKFATINWIPEKVPVLILGGSHDFLTPLSLFEQDQRFQQTNIEIISIPNAGHFPWMERADLIKDAFCSFMRRL